MATKRVCPHCGALVDSDNMYCTNCGLPMDSDTTQTVQTTQTFQATQATQATPTTPSNQGASGKPKGRTALIVVGTVAACLAMAAIVIVVNSFVLGNGSQSTGSTGAASTSTTATTEDSTDTSSGSSSGSSSPTGTHISLLDDSDDSDEGATSDSSDSSTTSDSATKAQLQGYVSTLNQLDGLVKDVASDFNAYAKNGTSGQQSSSAQEARNVQSSISGKAAEFDALSIPSSSSYYATYQDMRTCFDDLQHRIDCIVEAWDLRLQGASNYLRPITQQNDSDGINVYKTDFDRRMAGLGL